MQDSVFHNKLAISYDLLNKLHTLNLQQLNGVYSFYTTELNAFFISRAGHQIAYFNLIAQSLHILYLGLFSTACKNGKYLEFKFKCEG